MSARVSTILAGLQVFALVTVIARLASTGRAHRRLLGPVPQAHGDRVTVIVPVLNEQHRLAPCLEGLIGAGPEVVEILVVDSGSTDKTTSLVQAYAARDRRVRLVSAGLAPHSWNGKSWGLEAGWRARSPGVEWVLTVDADVRPSPCLVRSLLATAQRDGLPALSVAPLQILSSDVLSWLLHPSMLATLVYRFGIPGVVLRRPTGLLANGQVLLVRQDLLDELGGFRTVATANAEDVALARAISRRGRPFGFYQSEGLARVRMYRDGPEVWSGWLRSLAATDEQPWWRTLYELAVVTLAQGLPLLMVLLAQSLRRFPLAISWVNWVLLAVRLGVLVGMRRAYVRRRWWYWLSPLSDPVVSVALWVHAWRRRWTWRGRTFVVGGSQ